MDIQEIRIYLFMEIINQMIQSNSKYFHSFYLNYEISFPFIIENLKFNSKNNQLQE